MCRTRQGSHRVSVGVSILPLVSNRSVGLFARSARLSWLRGHFDVVFILVLVLVTFLILFVLVRSKVNFTMVVMVALRLRLRRSFLLLVLALELGNAALEVPNILDPCLENGELVHLHAFTGRYHVFEHSKLFIHLTTSPPFDDAMCCLACNLSTSRTRGRRLFPLGGRRGPGRLRG